MKTIINEGSAKINVEAAKIVSKEMDVFYNPIMGLNRDISVLLLKSINKNDMQIADPLAASGIRSIRFLKELSKNKIKNISINDRSKSAIKSIKQNLILNGISHKNNNKIAIKNEDANLFLLNSTGFDYIDIDPFGTPNQFLDSSCKRIARDGILAVTATDTSALCGTFPSACIRKYWAVPKKGHLMHETGLRILIRKVQLVAAQYGKALIPIFSYSREHYMRIFLRNGKGKNKSDEILKQHGYFNGAGPMWLGSLWDEKLAGIMHKNAAESKIFRDKKELIKLLKIIKGESKISAVGFYDLNYINEKNKIKQLPKKEIVKNEIKKSGYRASDTHFKGEGVRSDIPMEKLLKILKNLKNQ